jgi:hypothetical protein
MKSMGICQDLLGERPTIMKAVSRPVSPRFNLATLWARGFSFRMGQDRDALAMISLTQAPSGNIVILLKISHM